jgi:hypothetical protein
VAQAKHASAAGHRVERRIRALILAGAAKRETLRFAGRVGST